MAGPIYSPWAQTISVHENVAWFIERQMNQMGVPFYLEHLPPNREPPCAIASLVELREWVPAFLTHYQNDFITKMGHLDGILAVMPTGCLTGDTTVAVNRGGKSARMRLDHVVNKFNGGGPKSWDPHITTNVQSVIDGQVRLNEVVRAVATGVKPVHMLRTATGEEIKATADHVFFTPQGEVKLGDLRRGDVVLREVWPKRGDRKPVKPIYKMIGGMQHHPHASEVTHTRKAGRSVGRGYVTTKETVEVIYRVPEHRLVVEADLNGLPLADYIASLRMGVTIGLQFLDPTAHVHHRDGNTRNNARSNLEVLTEYDHLARHGTETHWRHLAGRVEPTHITYLAEAGEEPTFDLTMASPHNNYVANGLMVHNSGKTLAGIVYGLLREGPIVFVTRAAARRTICGEIRRYTTCEPVLLEGKTGRIIDPRTRFIVVGWESLQSHYQSILNVHPTTVIFDESHVASNHKRREAVVQRDEEAMEAAREEGKVKVKYRRLNNRFAAAEDLSRAASYRLALTATPIRDRVRNLWGQVDLIIPKGMGSFYPWAFRYAGAAHSPWGGINTDGRGGDAAMQELVARMSFFTFYIPQSVTHRDLPPLRRQVTYIPADELSAGKDVLRELKEHSYNSAVGEVWAKLAHAAAMKRDRVVDEAISGAFRSPDGQSGGKVVVFTGLRADCEKIAAKIAAVDKVSRAKGVPPLTVFMGHGGTNPKQRDEIREAYMAHPGPCVLVGTGDSWGESLNLQDTDLAIIAMLPWTPGQIRQWEGRFKRHGMKRPVLVLYLVGEGTADEHVAHALLNKLPAVEMVAKDEVLTAFATDLRGDEEAVAMGFLAKLTAGEEEDDDDRDVDDEEEDPNRLPKD